MDKDIHDDYEACKRIARSVVKEFNGKVKDGQDYVYEIGFRQNTNRTISVSHQELKQVNSPPSTRRIVNANDRIKIGKFVLYLTQSGALNIKSDNLDSIVVLAKAANMVEILPSAVDAGIQKL